jgi:TetR/AcrR family transcriptional regulator
MNKSESNIDTERLIKNAAKKVFLKKGLAGTRLQEIADEAGIGRTALHYYFRSKERLFEVVWKDFFVAIGKRIQQDHKENMSFTEHMQGFINNYMEQALEDPEIDIFMLNEFNNNSQMFTQIMEESFPFNPANFLLTAIQKAVDNREIEGNPQQIFMTIISMVMFPFAGMTMFKSLMKLSDEAYMALLQDRKDYIVKFLTTAFKI